MREIVLDTETTGLDPGADHRVVEIGCVELVNHVPSGRTFQRYVNPERDIPAEAVAVHGLTLEKLRRYPVFAEVAQDLLAFIADATLVIHNADFDLGFLNAELARAGRPPLVADRVVDTMLLARQKFPGAPASLDALCRRFEVDNSGRTRHGALLDARLLAAVYLELLGGRQAALGLGVATPAGRREGEAGGAVRAVRAARPHAPSEAEITAHEALVSRLSDPIWRM